MMMTGGIVGMLLEVTRRSDPFCPGARRVDKEEKLFEAKEPYTASRVGAS
jgi:hypothetical protein